MNDQTKRSRTKFLLLALLFFGPVIFAWWAYYFSDGWRPVGQTEHGDLVHPALPLPAFSLPGTGGQATALSDLKGKWTLLYVDGWDCDTSCVDALYHTRQVRLALGKELDRIQRLFLVNGPCCELRELSAEHPDLRIAWLDGPDAGLVAGALPTYGATEPLQAGRVYVIDPLGNLVMSYAPGFEPKGLLSDMKKLLKLSHIG